MKDACVGVGHGARAVGLGRSGGSGVVLARPAADFVTSQPPARASVLGHLCMSNGASCAWGVAQHVSAAARRSRRLAMASVHPPGQLPDPPLQPPAQSLQQAAPMASIVAFASRPAIGCWPLGWTLPREHASRLLAPPSTVQGSKVKLLVVFEFFMSSVAVCNVLVQLVQRPSS